MLSFNSRFCYIDAELGKLFPQNRIFCIFCISADKDKDFCVMGKENKMDYDGRLYKI